MQVRLFFISILQRFDMVLTELEALKPILGGSCARLCVCASVDIYIYAYVCICNTAYI